MSFKTTERGPISQGSFALPEPETLNQMKLNVWYLVALLPLGLLVASGAFGAQVAVLGLTLGIFFGTLSLRRPSPGDATTTNPGH